MPYIVTTKQPCDCDTGERTPMNCWSCSGRSVSRRAVATLEEARQMIDGLCVDLDGDELTEDAVDRLPESGGTVGPLPDGTEIQVERATWASLDRAALIAEHGTTLDPVTHMDRSLDCPESQVGDDRQQQILDAYNAAQMVA